MSKYYLINIQLKDENSLKGIHRNMDLFFKRLWIRPYESIYIVKSKYSTVQIANILKHFMDADDSLFVIKIDKEEWVVRSPDVQMTQLLNDF
ncbi:MULTISPECIES: hypothetical protein [unclassified Moraxella]|uniref:hypothetical protein n=1 Tax=unclassified Moraxella TaxID=2685852 RepID=UPI003AF65C16